MSAAISTSRDLPPPQLAVEKPTVRAVLSLSLQLIAGLIQLGLRLGLFTVYMVHRLIPDGTPEPSQPGPLCSATQPLEHLLETRAATPPPMLPATPSPPSTPTSPSTLPPAPYGDDNQGSAINDNQGSEVDNDMYGSGDLVETEEHGWSRADLTMSVLDMTAEEIKDIGRPASVADAPVGDSNDGDSLHSDGSSSSRWNRLSNQPHNPPLYELVRAPALNGMEYVEDIQHGCIYRTGGHLWECVNVSDSRKWYAVLRGTLLGVFDSWLRAGICTVDVDGAWLPHSFSSQEEAIIHFVHTVYAGVVGEKQILAQ